ncbi:MAG: hypothetical protein IK070_01915 [Clostridia bacterium]|nr:hypothetical protein [Clostridia bacterium]
MEDKKEYTIDMELSNKIKKCETLTQEYKIKTSETHDLKKLVALRKEYIHDFVKISPDLNWFAIRTYLFPTLLPDMSSNILRIGKLLTIRDASLAELCKEYKDGTFDHHVFNKVIKLFGQGEKVLRHNLTPEQFDLAMKENAGYVSLFDSIIINKMFMYENIERVADEIYRTSEYSGYPFVKDVEKFASQFAIKYNGSEEYIANLCKQLLDYKPIAASSLNEKYVGDEIDKNVLAVSSVEVTNNSCKHMFLNTKSVMTEIVEVEEPLTAHDEANNFMDYVQQKQIKEVTREVVHKLPQETLEECLPSGTSLIHILADKYCLNIDGFNITPLMLAEKEKVCTTIAESREPSIFER